MTQRIFLEPAGIFCGISVILSLRDADLSQRHPDAHYTQALAFETGSGKQILEVFSIIEQVWSDGLQADMNDRQKSLYNKYCNRTGAPSGP